MATLSIARQGRKPFIVLKPCSNETPAGIYSTRAGNYSPSKSNAALLMDFLNSFDVGVTTEKQSVDSKLPKRLPIRLKNITPGAVETKALMIGCNVLGACFLEFLCSFGVQFNPNRSNFRICPNDREFFEIIYPIFDGYFTEKRTSDPQLDNYLAGVVQNNTGIFTLIPVTTAENLEDLLAKIEFLKRVYRYAVKLCIPYNNETVRDNLVHSPENMEELILHSRLFAERIV